MDKNEGHKDDILIGRLLVVDDDDPFRRQLAMSMTRRGFDVESAANSAEALECANSHQPQYAIIDVRLGQENGLELVPKLREIVKDIRIVMLTGYGNITSAVNAIKVGAVDYLAKPADPDDIFGALTSQTQELPAPPENPMSPDRVRWEHIQRVYEMCNYNVSETARRLKMHRRTLQRILAKRSPQ